MSEIDPRKNAWLEHKATRECLDGLGAVPPCELDFQRGWNAHASHTAAIREKAEALVAKVDRLSGLLDKISGEMTDGEHGWMAALEKLEPELTALKAELDKK